MPLPNPAEVGAEAHLQFPSADRVLCHVVIVTTSGAYAQALLFVISRSFVQVRIAGSNPSLLPQREHRIDAAGL